MQTLPPNVPPPHHTRVRTITAYTLLAQVVVLVGIAASGALAPYIALHSIGGPQLVSLALPPLPKFAAPLVSGLAADAAVARDRSHSSEEVRVASAGSAGGTATATRAALRPAAVVSGPPAPVPQTPAAPPGGGVTPVDSGEPTFTPVPPPAGDGDEDPPPPVVQRPEKSKGHAYGVVKKAASPKPGKKHATVSRKTATAKKAPAVKKAVSAKPKPARKK